MSRSPNNYPWSTLLPQEILIEQLLLNDYNSLLILCMSNDERFKKVCTDLFWDRKLNYELETRDMTPQEFFDLSAINGWARFMAMLLNKYDINIDYDRVLPEAAANGHTLAVKILVNYFPDWVPEAEKELSEFRAALKNREAIKYTTNIKIGKISKSLESWKKTRKDAIIQAYEKALQNNMFNIVESLKDYRVFSYLKSFFNRTTIENLKKYIEEGSLQKLHSPLGKILIHIYNRDLENMEEFTLEEKREFLETASWNKILLFASDFYGPEVISFSETLNLYPKESYMSYQPKMINLISILVKEGKIEYAKALLRSEFIEGSLKPLELLKSSVISNNVQLVEFLLSEYDYTTEEINSVRKSAKREVLPLLS